MINIFKEFKEIFSSAILQIAKESNVEILLQDLENFTIEGAKDKTHGDLACNAAMVLVKKFSQNENLNNPRKLAAEIIKKISDKNIVKLEIAGAGFINIWLNNQIFYNLIAQINQEGIDFPNLGKGEKVNLEYASPNPTGPIHVGHTRGAIYGDVLAKLLEKCGFDVLKEYYINDAGAQINTLLKSAFVRYKQALGLDVEISEGLYPGQYLIDIGQKLKEKFQDKLINKNEEEVLVEIRDFVVGEMLELIKSDLLALGIKHDSYFSEKKELHDKNKIEKAVNLLKEKGLIYEGKLEVPKTEKGVGALPEGYSSENQTLFKSTLFGDDQDRVVQKADGSYTYFGADLAYILSKFERGATKFIMPLGYDHAGYVKRLTAAVDALTDKKAQLKIILCQMVKFVKNGEPLKMSKRAGNFICAREVIDEVGADALRFIMLTRKNDAHFDFDLEKVVEASKDNAIFYVQYAHARCCSALRQAKEIVGFNLDEQPDLALLNDESEIEIMKKIAAFPKIIEAAVVNFEPHRLAFYLQELASLLHALWNKGMENPDLKFVIKDNLQITNSRLYLLAAFKKIVASAFEIFNIKALEEMR
jgi:arginyl-tRNA synthetase